MTDPYNAIRRRLRTYNVRGTLRNMVRELKAAIDNNPEYTGSLHRYLRAGEAERQRMRPILPPAVEAYLIAAWIVEAKSQARKPTPSAIETAWDFPSIDLISICISAWRMPGPLSKRSRRKCRDPWPARSPFHRCAGS